MRSSCASLGCFSRRVETQWPEGKKIVNGLEKIRIQVQRSCPVDFLPESNQMRAHPMLKRAPCESEIILVANVGSIEGYDHGCPPWHILVLPNDLAQVPLYCPRSKKG
jgi:hypothetical protein